MFYVAVQVSNEVAATSVAVEESITLHQSKLDRFNVFRRTCTTKQLAVAELRSGRNPLEIQHSLSSSMESFRHGTSMVSTCSMSTDKESIQESLDSIREGSREDLYSSERSD